MVYAGIEWYEVETGETLRGVFKSTDSGAHWTAANTGLPADTNINTLAIDPQTPATIYAGAGNIYYPIEGGVVQEFGWWGKLDGCDYWLDKYQYRRSGD